MYEKKEIQGVLKSKVVSSSLPGASMGHERMSRGADESKLLLDWLFPLILTLFTPAYLSISKNEGGAHCAPPKYLGVGWG